MKKRLVILSDYGLDDAVAGIYLLENSDKFLSIDIVAIAGNSSSLISFNNAKKLLSNYNGDLSKVRLIDTTRKHQDYAHLPSIHGNDGMGDLLEVKKYNFTILDYDDWFKAGLDDILLLSLGPLTITKEIMDTYKNIELVIMAGMVDAEPNFKGMEFNQALDADSYNYCLKFDHVVATLDTCRHKNFNLAGARLKENNLLNKLINKAVLLAEARHIDNSYIYDFISALYLIMPHIFTVIKKGDKWCNTVFELVLNDNSFVLKDYVNK